MNTIKLFVASVFTVGLLACGGGAAGDVKKLKEEACACKDKACAEAVNKKLDKAIEGFKSEKEIEAAAKDLGEAGACLAKHGMKAE